VSIISLDKNKTAEMESLMKICKSDSQIYGMKLRDAHYKLGRQLARRMIDDLHDKNITMIIMMRAGFCFGMGIADELEESGVRISILFYYNKKVWEEERINQAWLFANNVILVDAVINSGDTIIRLAQSLQNNGKLIFASNVISAKAIHKFEDKYLYVVRISERSFIGSKQSIVKDGKGPDTGDKLFTPYWFT